MGRVAFDIAGAAEASSINETTITLAIRDRQLPAYRIDNQAVILRDDITDWVKTQERF